MAASRGPMAAMNAVSNKDCNLALNAYLCFCSAFGCFEAARYAYRMLCYIPDELFYMGFVFTLAGGILIILADFKVPTAIWGTIMRKGSRVSKLRRNAS